MAKTPGTKTPGTKKTGTTTKTAATAAKKKDTVSIDLPTVSSAKIEAGHRTNQINVGKLSRREIDALHHLRSACYHGNVKIPRTGAPDKPHDFGVADTIRFILNAYADAVGVE